MRILLQLASALAALLILTGCAAPLIAAVPLGMDAARAGATAYTRGELRVARYATLEETWDATHEALDRLQLVVQVERIGERRWYVMAKDENRGPEMQIRLDRRSPVLTKINIRVGVLGDPAVSSQLLRHIDASLVERRSPPIVPLM